jgi:hypothetical protein
MADAHWTEGVRLMTVGEKARFWIPAEAASGGKPTQPGALADRLVFDAELDLDPPNFNDIAPTIADAALLCSLHAPRNRQQN